MSEHVGHQPAGAPEPSTADLVRRVSEQVSLLVRDEMRLVRLEMREKGLRVGVGSGLFGVSGVLALLGLGSLVAGAVLALALVVPAWAAALIIGAVLLVVAGGAALLGRGRMRAAQPLVPRQAAESVREDLAEIRHRAGDTTGHHRGRS